VSARHLPIVASSLLAACSGGAGVSVDSGSPDARTGVPAEVHRIGRFDPSDRFAWPGSALWTRFDGAELSVDLEDNGNMFDVIVDGEPSRVLLTDGSGSYSIVSGLASGEHDLVLARRTESFFGASRFVGFTGSPLVATAGPTRWIEMIGDSITCGYGVLGDVATCPFSADTEAETHAWGAKTAAMLGAAHVAIAYSGKGVYRNYGGDLVDPVPAIYDRVIADDPSSTYDFADYTPDVVVINLGTNDFSNDDQGNPVDPGAAYVSAFVDFAAVVRQRYPQAWIVLALSPMLSDSYPAGAMHRTLERQYLQEVVSTRTTAGDDRISFLEIDEQDDADGYGCDYHPSEATQQIMAEALAARIRELTGWQ